MRPIYLLAVLTVIAGGLAARPTSKADEALAAPQARDCSLERLGELLVRDAALLVPGPQTRIAVQNTEGAVGRAYFDGEIVRMYVATFAGEGGRVEERYYLGDSLDFVVERSELFYDRSFSDGKQHLSSRVPGVYFFCGGKQVRGEAEKRLTREMLTIRDRVVRHERPPRR